MKKLGVVGGLGPAASAYYYELLTKLAVAGTDQQHPEVIIYSCPSIPDRTAFILGQSNESPVPALKEIIKTLITLNVDIISIPCITAHCFYDELTQNINIPIIHMLKETSAYLNRAGIRKAGILATSGAIKAGLFQNELLSAGIEPVLLPENAQNQLMNVIYSIKANKTIDINNFLEIAEIFHKENAQKIILGCTELSTINKYFKLSGDFIDTLEILAHKSLELCGVSSMCTS